MTYLTLALVGIVAYYFFANFETVGGVRHFTKHGRTKALECLAHASVQVSTQIVPNAATFQLVSPILGGVAGNDAVLTAEQNGGVIVCYESVLDISTSTVPVTALLLVTADIAEANAIARPGSSFAVLSFV